jgi:multicomponent Na+:H+ antiporter subunit B
MRMTSLILGTTARLIVPILLLFSVFLLVRGHNEPGGGFAGGLVAAAAFTLVAIAQDATTGRRAPGFEPPVLIGAGLLVAIGAGLAGIVAGQPFFTGQWLDVPVAGDLVVEIGTPLIFDLGVYLVVLGTTLGIVLELIDEQGRAPRGPGR